MKNGFYDNPSDFLGSDEKICESYESAKKNKRSIETTNPFLKTLLLIEEGRLKFSVDMSNYLPKPKHMMLNGDYTTIVWEDGTSTVLHLMPGELYDPEKAVLYGILKKIFKNKNADLDRYMCEFFDHSISCNKKKSSKKKKSTRR